MAKTPQCFARELLNDRPSKIVTTGRRNGSLAPGTTPSSYGVEGLDSSKSRGSNYQWHHHNNEVVVMFALVTSYADAFQAGPGCLVVRKLRLSGLVEFGRAAGLGSRAYHVPAEVWRELPRFKERWQKVVEAGGVNSPEQLQTRVRAILALPGVEH